MKRLLVLVAVLAVVPAGSAASRRERLVAGTVSAGGIAGTEVGYSVEYRPACHEVRRWDVATGADVRIARRCYVSTSTGSGVAAVAVTAGRALWLTYTGGNAREWTLWTRRGTAPARQIGFVTADVDGPAPIVVGRAWEGSLPYAIGHRVVVLAPNGSRRLAVAAPEPVRALTAHSRGYAAVLADGSVLRISPTGRILGRTPFEPGFARSAVLAAPGLVVGTVEGLEIHGGDRALRRIRLPPGARFLGLSEGIVAYKAGRQLRLLRLANGHDVVLRTLAPAFHAELGRRGIAYASGRTLGFVGWVTLDRSV